MNSDTQKLFLQEISEVIDECTHGGNLELSEFENKITGVWAAAFAAGVSRQEFTRLLSTSISSFDESFYQSLDLDKIA